MKVIIQVKIKSVDKRIDDAIVIPGTYGWLVENAMEGTFSKEVEKSDMPNIESEVAEMASIMMKVANSDVNISYFA